MSKHLAKHAASKKSRKDDLAEKRSDYKFEAYDSEDYFEEEEEPVRSAPVIEEEEEPVRRASFIEEEDEEDEADYESLRARKKKGRKLLVALIIIVAFIIILAELAYLAFGYFYNKMNYTGSLTEEQRAAAIASYVEVPEEPAEGEEGEDSDAANVSEDELSSIQASIQAQLGAGGSLMSSKDVINILLVGTDARELDEQARSDVMMLASLNKNTHKIILTSFMRDIYTYIPDYGYNRLNAPYAIAGADYLMETLEADFGVDINNYAAVNFYAFADVIDAIGGIDLELTKSEVDFINGQAYDGEQAQLGVGTGAVYLEYTDNGTYHLNGTQALAHCRNRSSAGSDFDRTSRQRIVISTMIEKAKSASLSELYSLVDTILPMVSTDLTQGDCLSLLLKSAEYLGYEVESLRIPIDGSYSNAMINGMAVLSIDFDSTAKALQEAIYGVPGSTTAPAAEETEAAPIEATRTPAEAAPPAPLEEAMPAETAAPAEASVPEPLDEKQEQREIFNEVIGGIGVTFYESVPNDVTGNWRVAVIHTKEDIAVYSYDYYNAYFTDDSEIHFVCNLGLKTTSRITFDQGILTVEEYSYVDGEEHDANVLPGGDKLVTYVINVETGEYEEIKG